MALPSKKCLKRLQRQRRAQIKLKKIKLFSCSNCQKLIPLHQTCSYCGYYKGRRVLKIKEKEKNKKTKS